MKLWQLTPWVTNVVVNWTPCFIVMQVGSFITTCEGKTPDTHGDNSRAATESLPHTKLETSMCKQDKILRCCVECCHTELNPVTPRTSRWTACAFLKMRPNEKASIQSYVNAPFVDAGAIPTANAEPHAGLNSHLSTHLKSGSLYLNIQWKTLCVLHLWLFRKCSLEAIKQQFVAC